MPRLRRPSPCALFFSLVALPAMAQPADPRGGRFALGGFGADWQTAVTVGYRFDLGGARPLSQEFQNSHLVWDVTMHGSIIGADLRF
ncbi:hypothetical protein [Roseococcus pinisoli]|uniref:Outer membrane protein beta-barrel domain-containing protein n=1 Tax=Roseococcus pinisoli TaxID=2835040 RepID=A0ABS5QJE8_9PROT|nr:hypothetical protein [Roseococcus pinisoli]MBS7813759.1 hypothetical protein [Roseococcus pinisoli]